MEGQGTNYEEAEFTEHGDCMKGQGQRMKV